MRRILALTSIRSDYDLMSGLYARLHVDRDVELKLLVSGTHLSPAHGYSVRNIREDGVPILAEVETLLSADTPSSRLKSAAGLLSAAIDLTKTFAPDVIVYAGDREDVLVGAMLGGFLGIPTAHFFGGDHARDGHVDNPIRHATSKLSTVHLVSLEEHRQRLLAIGEPSRRIFVIGSVAIDKFVTEATMPRAVLLSAMKAKRHATNAPLAVLIFHPIEEERLLAGAYVRTATEALVQRGFHVCIGAPNTDPGNFALSEALNALAQRPEVTYYGNLERIHFVNLLRQASLIVGNSSAGLLEAATLPIAAINIGTRQRGRLCADNVIFCEPTAEGVDEALERAASAPFQTLLRDVTNPYGDGHSAERAVEILKTLDMAALLKKVEDPLDALR